MLVQPLGERLGEAIRQCFQQDIVIIVMRGAIAFQMWLDAVDADREAADPVARRVDEIGQAHVGAALALGDLLAQHRQANAAFVAAVHVGHRDMLRHRRAIGGAVVVMAQPHPHVIVMPVARPQPDDALRGQPFLRHDPVQHRARIGKIGMHALGGGVTVWLVAIWRCVGANTV